MFGVLILIFCFSSLPRKQLKEKTAELTDLQNSTPEAPVSCAPEEVLRSIEFKRFGDRRHSFKELQCSITNSLSKEFDSYHWESICNPDHSNAVNERFPDPATMHLMTSYDSPHDITGL